MSKVILALVNAKNAVENAFLVRVIWAIIGAVGFYVVADSLDEERVKKGFKPMYLARNQMTEPISKETFDDLED